MTGTWPTIDLTPCICPECGGSAYLDTYRERAGWDPVAVCPQCAAEGRPERHRLS